MEKPTKVPWIISFQRKNLLTACWGSEKEANLLYHFLHKASWEVKNNKLQDCKVIPFQETHDEILKSVPMAEGTLIKYLKRFNLAGYVSSGRYGTTFTVNVETIQAAFTNPPEKPLSSPRGRPKGFKVSRINKTENSETSEDNTETLPENSEVSRFSEPEEVARLNEKVLSLQLEVLSLKEKVLNLELLVLNLKLSKSDGSAPEAATEAKVSLQNDLEMIKNDIEKRESKKENENDEQSECCADAQTHTTEIPYLPDFMGNQQEETKDNVPPVPEDAGKKPKRTRTPRAPKIDPQELDLYQRVFDDCFKEATEDESVGYAHTKASNKCITDLLEMNLSRPKFVTPQKLHAVYVRLWNMPKDERTGFWWREHMSIKAICKNYEAQALALTAAAREKQQQATMSEEELKRKAREIAQSGELAGGQWRYIQSDPAFQPHYLTADQRAALFGGK